MKFDELYLKMKDRHAFRLADLHKETNAFSHEIVQISRWVGQGKIIRLKKGLYTLARNYRTAEPSALALAQLLYRPSYISLEWALSTYGLIPEASGTITSVTSLKTAHFKNASGHFMYRHVKPVYFFGYVQQNIPVSHWIAEPEKALLDFIYLSIPPSQQLSEGLFINGYRMQNLHSLRKGLLKQFIHRFNHPRVRQGGELLLALANRTKNAND